MKDPDYARTVFSRACNIHIIKKFKIHLRWAVFEERQNKYEKASSILRNIDLNFPGMSMITQKRVGVARRMNRLDDAVTIYQQAIHNAEIIEDKVFYSIKLAHILAKVFLYTLLFKATDFYIYYSKNNNFCTIIMVIFPDPIFQTGKPYSDIKHSQLFLKILTNTQLAKEAILFLFFFL